MIVNKSWITAPFLYTDEYLFPYLDTKTGEVIVVDWYGVRFADMTKEELEELRKTLDSDPQRYRAMPLFSSNASEGYVLKMLQIWCKEEGIEIVDGKVA